MLIDLSCPVENQGITVRSNPETGDSYLLLKLYNISKKTITSLNYIIKAFDESGSEITSLSVELNELDAAPNEYFAENKAVSLDGITDAKNFTFEVVSATFEDGEVYEFSEENLIEYDDSELSLSEALELRKLFPDAICYAEETESYWRCPCGRPNLPEAENCARCGYSKEKALYSFSSKSALLNAIKENEEELERIKEEEILLKAAKKKKVIRGLIISGIIIVGLAVLVFAGYFIRASILNSQANKALENGDYLKAYELYTETGSKKRYEITDKVMGNTQANLSKGNGYLAEDDENLYFITYSVYGQPKNLVKESKSTKEKTILTDAAYGCLNVVGDKVYFMNADSYPASVTKDGKEIEILFETPVYYRCVVADDLYYVKVDYDNPKGFTEEECEILASQGQMESYTRIHKFNLKTGKDTLVSEENVLDCSIYGDKIYFLTNENTEDYWVISNLKSMDLDGKNVSTIIDMPIRSFLIKDNYLYYIQYYYDEYKGTEISSYDAFDCSIMKMDLSTGEKSKITADEEMVLDINISGDDLIYSALDRETYMTYVSATEDDLQPPSAAIYSRNIKTGNRTNLVLASPDSINVCGDNIFYLLSYQGMTRITKDLSVFETVYEDGTSSPPQVEETTETELNNN